MLIFIISELIQKQKFYLSAFMRHQHNQFNDTHRERLVFHSIQYGNGWLAASDFFPMFTQSIKFLSLFRMGFFGAAHGWGGGAKRPRPLPKICHTYPTIMKLGSYTLPKEDAKDI